MSEPIVNLILLAWGRAYKLLGDLPLVMVVVGLAVALSQVFTVDADVAVFALGVLIALLGAVALSDRAGEETGDVSCR